MAIRFLADANLDYAIVQGVRRREPAIDFKSANDAGLEGLPDDAVLDVAAGEGRVLVSHDKRSLPVYFVAGVRAGLRTWSASSSADRIRRRGRRIGSDHLVRLTRGGVDGSDSLLAVLESPLVPLIVGIDTNGPAYVTATARASGDSWAKHRRAERCYTSRGQGMTERGGAETV